MPDRLDAITLEAIKRRAAHRDVRTLVEEVERLRVVLRAAVSSLRNADGQGDITELSSRLTVEIEPRFMVTELRAPCDGRVKSVWKDPGEHVLEGHGVVVLHPGRSVDNVTSPSNGTVDRLLVAVDEEVTAGQLLAILKSPWDGGIDPEDPGAPAGTDEAPPARQAPADGWSSF